jgi:hypothetical protein
MPKELTDTQLEYVQWRAQPQGVRGTKKGWADDHGINERTLQRWESESWFRPALERELAKLNVEPDRIQVVLDALWKEAKGGDVQAAREYLKAVEELRPPRPSMEDASVASLTDEELELAWEEGMAALQRQRAQA